jgi:hypothetical protein
LAIGPEILIAKTLLFGNSDQTRQSLGFVYTSAVTAAVHSIALCECDLAPNSPLHLRVSISLRQVSQLQQIDGQIKRIALPGKYYDVLKYFSVIHPSAIPGNDILDEDLPQHYLDLL